MTDDSANNGNLLPAPERPESPWVNVEARTENENRVSGYLLYLSMKPDHLERVLSCPSPGIEQETVADVAAGIDARDSLRLGLVKAMGDYAVFCAAGRRQEIEKYSSPAFTGREIEVVRDTGDWFFPGKWRNVQREIASSIPLLALICADRARQRLQETGFDKEADEIPAASDADRAAIQKSALKTYAFVEERADAEEAIKKENPNPVTQKLDEYLGRALNVVDLSDDRLQAFLVKNGGTEEALEYTVVDTALKIAQAAVEDKKLSSIWPLELRRIAAVDISLAGEAAQKFLNRMVSAHLQGIAAVQEDFVTALQETWKYDHYLRQRGFYYEAAEIAADLKVMAAALDLPADFRQQMDGNLSSLMTEWQEKVRAQDNADYRAAAQAAIDEIRKHDAFQSAPAAATPVASVPAPAPSGP